MLGEAAHELKITPELFTQWENDEDASAQIEKATETLRKLELKH